MRERLCSASLTQLTCAFSRCKTYLAEVCGFNKNSTSVTVWAPLCSPSGTEHGALAALRGSWARAARCEARHCILKCSHAACAGEQDLDPQHGGIQVCFSHWHPNRQVVKSSCSFSPTRWACRDEQTDVSPPARCRWGSLHRTAKGLLTQEWLTLSVSGASVLSHRPRLSAAKL